MKRHMYFAGSFYPESENKCMSMIKDMLKNLYTIKIENVNAGIVPHAGWVYSGKISLSVFNAIKEINKDIDTFVLFSANHSAWISVSAIMTYGSWETPFGDVEIDEDLGKKILNKGKFYIEENFSAHEKEHSLEVQLPFIKFLFPNAKIVPIMPVDYPVQIGEIVGEIVKEEKEKGKKIVIVGTSDLTHYGSNYGFAPKGYKKDAVEWVKNVNDKRMIDLMINMENDKIVDEAERNFNACGSYAIAATVTSAKFFAKKGYLLAYTTSYDVFPEYGSESFVGYAGILF